jgi:hypothetical protein
MPPSRAAKGERQLVAPSSAAIIQRRHLAVHGQNLGSCGAGKLLQTAPYEAFTQLPGASWVKSDIRLYIASDRITLSRHCSHWGVNRLLISTGAPPCHSHWRVTSIVSVCRSRAALGVFGRRRPHSGRIQRLNLTSVRGRTPRSGWEPRLPWPPWRGLAHRRSTYRRPGECLGI